MPRRSWTGSTERTSRPSTSIRPEVGSTSRLIIFNVVVLPQPDPPNNTSICPAGTRRLTLQTATWPVSYVLLTCLRTIIGKAFVLPRLERFSTTDYTDNTDKRQKI